MATKPIEMAHVVQATMTVPGCPVLTSNQAHAVAMKLREILNQPAKQHQGDPVAKLRDGELIKMANKAAPHPTRDNDMFYIAMGRLVEEYYTHHDAGEVDRLRAQLAEQDMLLRGLVEYADGLLADCNRAWCRAGRCADDDVHEDADYLKAVKLLSVSAEPSASVE